MRKGLIAAGVVVIVGGVTAALYSKSNSSSTNGLKTVPVARGSVVEKALAIGAIKPKREIAVKSKISGIVKTSFREIGRPGAARRPAVRDPARPDADGAHGGAPRGRDRQERLRPGEEEVRPLADAQGPGHPRDPGLGSGGEGHPGRADPPRPRERAPGADREGPRQDRAPFRRVDHPRADRGHRPRAARERGRSGRAAHLVPGGHRAHQPRRHERRSSSRAPSTRSTWASSTRACRRTSRSARCPTRRSTGGSTRSRPSPRPRKARHSSTWRSSSCPARASSCARATRRTPRSPCARSTTCCTIPERLVTFEDGKASVELPGKGEKDEPVKKEIKTGLSDGMNVEVAEGLTEKDLVVERPPKKIE